MAVEPVGLTGENEGGELGAPTTTASTAPLGPAACEWMPDGRLITTRAASPATSTIAEVSRTRVRRTTVARREPVAPEAVDRAGASIGAALGTRFARAPWIGTMGTGITGACSIATTGASAAKTGATRRAGAVAGIVAGSAGTLTPAASSSTGTGIPNIAARRRRATCSAAANSAASTSRRCRRAATRVPTTRATAAATTTMTASVTRMAKRSIAGASRCSVQQTQTGHPFRAADCRGASCQRQYGEGRRSS